MRSQVIWCIATDIFAALLSIALLYLYPAARGFTFTFRTTTHFVQAAPLLAALLMICVSILVAVYLAFRIYSAV